MSDSSQQSDKDDSFFTLYISDRLNNLTFGEFEGL